MSCNYYIAIITEMPPIITQKHRECTDTDSLDSYHIKMQSECVVLKLKCGLVQKYPMQFKYHDTSTKNCTISLQIHGRIQH